MDKLKRARIQVRASVTRASKLVEEELWGGRDHFNLGTFINDPCNVDAASNLLQVDFQDLCASHLRPDFVDNHYFLSDSDEDDDFDDLYDVDFDVVGSPAMFFGDDIGEYYGYLAFMGGRDFNNSDFEFDDESDLE